MLIEFLQQQTSLLGQKGQYGPTTQLQIKLFLRQMQNGTHFAFWGGERWWAGLMHTPLLIVAEVLRSRENGYNDLSLFRNAQFSLVRDAVLLKHRFLCSTFTFTFSSNFENCFLNLCIILSREELASLVSFAPDTVSMILQNKAFAQDAFQLKLESSL